MLTYFYLFSHSRISVGREAECGRVMYVCTYVLLKVESTICGVTPNLETNNLSLLSSPRLGGDLLHACCQGRGYEIRSQVLKALR